MLLEKVKSEMLYRNRTVGHLQQVCCQIHSFKNFSNFPQMIRPFSETYWRQKQWRERDEGETQTEKGKRTRNRQTDRQRDEKYVATDKERGDKQS